jgi:protein-S-isoprenylcysteine O-methyltransferase Ste14
MKAPSLGLMMLPLFLHPFLSSIGFAFRRQPVKVIAGLMPRVTSYVSTFGMVLFFLVAGYWKPDWVASDSGSALSRAGNVIWFVGGLLDAFVVWSLRHSMSIVPQARKLITTGPYRFARHPLYAVYMVELAGLWLRYTNFPVDLVFIGWLLLTLHRIRYEESVLQAAFPEYADYRCHVGMFWPRRLIQVAQPAALRPVAVPESEPAEALVI